MVTCVSIVKAIWTHHQQNLVIGTVNGLNFYFCSKKLSSNSERRESDFLIDSVWSSIWYLKFGRIHCFCILEVKIRVNKQRLKMAVEGGCPTMDLLRSEPMQLVQLIIPAESAHRAISYLGDLGLFQFKDVCLISVFHSSLISLSQFHLMPFPFPNLHWSSYVGLSFNFSFDALNLCVNLVFLNLIHTFNFHHDLTDKF